MRDRFVASLLAVTNEMSLRGRRIVSEAASTVGLLRAFGPRKDWWGVTASLVLRPPFVTASLACSFGEAVSEIPRRFAARKD
jgi:hypothetical protein